MIIRRVYSGKRLPLPGRVISADVIWGKKMTRGREKRRTCKRKRKRERKRKKGGKKERIRK
jgi:hypothetical protein